MGDRGDFEAPEDIYRGGGYRPTAPSGMSFDEFKAEPATARAVVYGSLAFAIMDDLGSLDDDQLLLLGYGMLVDRGTPEMEEVFQEIPEFETLFNDANQFLASGSRLDDQGHMIVLDQAIVDARDTFSRWDRAVPERLQIPVTTAAIVLGFKGAVASSALGPAITTSLPLLHGGGSAAATKAAVVAGAMRITGGTGYLGQAARGGVTLGRMAIGAGVGGSLVSVTVGGTNQVLSALSNWFAGEEHQTQEDIQRGLADAATMYAESTQPQGGPTPGSPAAQAIQASAGAAPEWFVANAPGVTPQLGPVPPGSPLDPNVDLASQIPGFAEAAFADDPSIRVPFGFPERQNLSELPDPDTGLLPSYTRNDITEALSNLSVGNVIRLQALGVRAGLLSDPEGGLPNFLPGARDEQTEIALATFMGQANIDREQSWWMTADRMAKLGDAAKAAAEAEKETFRPRYVREPFFKLDQASIRQRVDQEMERELGRPVNDWEWATFLNNWQQDHRQGYEQEQAAKASLFEAQYREGQSHTAQSAGTFQAIDPQARFDEQFQTMFAGELNRKKRTEQVAGMTGNLMQALSNAESAVTR